ncbi:CAF17-like 4Fe-4S cluster assembly/insertion protein YgfZ [Marivivens aquimaris]|uniref:CAF17-like 4Fe-4S cluster assembly/insertion protein YgfZ n=1 Tax=Marivivens aquimaris TaxID=2774876 RepID=UPI00187DDFDD|nr:folate-binding protein YgfZ [Marivivens aquimaris]
MSTRTILAVTGSDREKFLQGLVTNDVAKARGGIAYAALLTPQGKYLADFFMIGQEDRILIDVDTSLAPMLLQRLSMYKLRSNVQLEATDMPVARGTGDAPEGALIDPRDPAMGWRLYGSEGDDGTDWDALRVEHLIPETGRELGPDSYILEMGFERLNGVDFKKGCYVGQEVTARMKHKTELKKGLARVTLDAPVDAGTDLTSNDRPAGTVHTVSGNKALAYLRFDRAENLTAGTTPAKVD